MTRPSIEPSERRTVLLGFLWFFHLLMSYYILRPIRETMGVSVGRDAVADLYLVTFLAMLVGVPVYAWLASCLRRRWLVATVYQFFAICLVGFWFTIRSHGGAPTPPAAKCLYVWVSVYNLFVVSVFWSFMTDVFRTDQAKRLFPLLAAGGTLGGVCGSAVTSYAASALSTAELLLIPALLLQACIAFAFGLGRKAIAEPSAQIHSESEEKKSVSITEDDDTTVANSMWDGLWAVVASPYLLGICAFVLLGKLCGTVIYFQQMEIVGAALADNQDRTQLFASINMAVQIITLVLQTLVTARLFAWIGLTMTLVVLPAVYFLGFAALGLAAFLPVLIVVEVAHRAVAYGVIVPAREVLFTVVSRAEKYQSKNFIDTVIWRGGDVAASNFYQSLRWLGLATSAISWLMLPIAVVWMAGCVWLGGRYQQLASASKSGEESDLP